MLSAKHVYASSVRYSIIKGIVGMIMGGMDHPDFQPNWSLRLRVSYIAINYFDFSPEEAESWMDSENQELLKGN